MNSSGTILLDLIARNILAVVVVVAIRGTPGGF